MRWLRKAFLGAGHTSLVLLRSLGYLVRKPRASMTARLMYEYGLKSLPVVAIVAMFSGMIICLQIGLEVARYGEQEVLGFVVAQTFAREFGPFMTCIILVGTSVSAFAAEVGTMKVSEEVDALEVMSIDPVGFLAAPRIFALAVMALLLTLCADLIGIVGGGIVANSQTGLAYPLYFERAFESLEGREWFGLPRDLFAGLLKAGLTGLVIAAVGCSHGLRAEGGALGVGRAVRSAVIASIVLILVISYVFSWLVYRAFV